MHTEKGESHADHRQSIYQRKQPSYSLPKAFRVNVEEMWIARNDVTGEITLKPKDTVELRRKRLDQLMAAIAENPLPESFLSDDSRQNDPPRNPFADWENSPTNSITKIKETT